MNIPLGPAAAIAAVILSAILAYFVRVNAQLKKQSEEITELKTKVSPLWAQIQSRIASDLHQPHPRYMEMDQLLEKLEALTITKDERARLGVLLQLRSQDMSGDVSEIQRHEANLMMQVMHIVVLEAKGIIGTAAIWISVHLFQHLRI